MTAGPGPGTLIFMNAATKSAAIAALDSEIALLRSLRATATKGGELDMINDGIEAARAERRALARTR